ncbi:MAG TPA: RagB/SusD family nutrient uptake outer membrane protein [Puia sp.]|nr:RagB/SusD family nutrient uptake outer membrane protein [Puia sp.]
MKKHFKIIAILFLLGVSQTACKKDFLEVIPKGEQVAVTTADYDLLLNSYSLYNYLNGGGFQEEMVMGDDVAAEAGLFTTASPQPQLTRVFQWADVVYEPKDLPLDLQAYLGSMYTCNKVINEVLTSESGTDDQKKSLQAEAMADRAFLNFILINSYGKPYLASSAATDPGWPIITTANIAATGFKRNTVQEMYDFIIKDLTAAIAVLPAQSVSPSRISRAGAEALLGKVYVFMGKYSEALPLLTAAFGDVAAATTPARLYDYNVELAPGGSFLPIGFYGPNGPGNNYQDFTESVLAKIFYCGSYNGNGFGNDGLVLDPKTAALYGSSDLRLQLYAANNPDGSSNPAGRLRKYAVQYANFGLGLSELYLLSAECKARTNDLAGATTDVETLRKSRMPAADASVPSATAADQTALIKFIIDERTREFAMEGFRWFDMRRLSVDPLFTGAIYTHTLYDATNGNTVYTLKQPDRLTMQLPPFYIAANPGMENNP